MFIYKVKFCSSLGESDLRKWLWCNAVQWFELFKFCSKLGGNAVWQRQATIDRSVSPVLPRTCGLRVARYLRANIKSIRRLDNNAAHEEVCCRKTLVEIDQLRRLT